MHAPSSAGLPHGARSGRAQARAQAAEIWRAVIAPHNEAAEHGASTALSPTFGGGRRSAGAAEHRTVGAGTWVAGQGWVTAAELRVGEVLMTAEQGLATLSAALSREGRRTVYNLEVEGWHTYFVGEAGAWVHNACRCGGGDSTKIPSRIYREGRANPSNLKPRPQDEGALSFRDSLSNPVPKGERPVLRPGKDYIEVDTSKLPPGSVIPDDNPPGHVSVVNVDVDTLKEAVVGRGRFPE